MLILYSLKNVKYFLNERGINEIQNFYLRIK